MATDYRGRLREIRTFRQLVPFLRDEMGWPIGSESFDDLTFDYTPDELGIDAKNAAKIQEIKRLRPLKPNDPWGIFFVKFEPKRLPVVALRRILSQVALKKRASANKAERQAWAADDLLFVSNYGEGDERQITFAHFARSEDGRDLPTLKVLGWNNLDTALHLDNVAQELTENLRWPGDDGDVSSWRERWRNAFRLRHREVVTTSRELSVRLAELARAIRDRIKTALAIETEKGPLTQLMRAFQTALVHDLNADGFADMYAQTIAYGLLSARIADPHVKTADDFSTHMRTNPFLRELMETFLKVGGRHGKAGGPGIDFDELGTSEVVELLDDANMEAVVRDFGDRNSQEDPVIHFYELFLKEYDAEKRMQRGVFYTPRPVVSYIVRSVHELLRTEFGLEDGLADTASWAEMAKRHKDLTIPDGISPEQDFVQVLDPATGTGTFLVEVIDLVYETLVSKWKAQGHSEKKINALWNEYVPTHLLTRLHGYELLMAPYAIAHLKVGLKLYETAYHFGGAERARIYLANSLEPANKLGQLRLEGVVSALAHEARAVSDIKQRQKFTVVIGNPPYSVMSGNLSAEARATVNAYRYVDGVRIREKSMLRLEMQLQDDYIKFFRLAQTSIDASGRGVLAFISNHSYLDNPTLRGMRDSLTRSFGEMWVLDLHGNSRKKGDAPLGVENDNVFDIQQGVAVTIAERATCTPNRATVRRADLFGSRVTKYRYLSDASVFTTTWTHISPSPPFYLFVVQDTSLRSEYENGVSIAELMPLNSVGIMSGREALTYDIDKSVLAARIAEFCDPSHSDEWVRQRFAIRDAGGYLLGRRRRRVVGKDALSFIRPLDFRPFDRRWVAYSSGFLTADQLKVMQHVLNRGNYGLVATRQTKENWGVFVARNPIAHKAISAYDPSSFFPLFLRQEADGLRVGHSEGPNLSETATHRLFGDCWSEIEIPEVGEREVVPKNIFAFAYAVFHSPGYRSRYAELLKVDFPRLPLTGNLVLFRTLARLGNELVALHLLESPRLDRPITEYVGRRRPQVEKVSRSNHTIWLDEGQTNGFKCVRDDVWNFHIGGYQVCEKWLKDRKGRTLSTDDIVHYQKIVVAVSETIRLMKEIDEVIEQHGGWPAAFQTSAIAESGKQALKKVAETPAKYNVEKGRGSGST